MPFEIQPQLLKMEDKFKNPLNLELVILDPKNKLFFFDGTDINANQRNLSTLLNYIAKNSSSPIKKMVDELLTSLDQVNQPNLKAGLICYIIRLAKTALENYISDEMKASMENELAFLIQRNFSGLKLIIFPSLKLS